MCYIKIDKYFCQEMIKFEAITIFPDIFKSYIGESLIARAIAKKLIKINIHDLRKWGKGPHKQVDDRPYGGGLGMVMQVEPIYKAIKALKPKAQSPKPKNKVILFIWDTLKISRNNLKFQQLKLKKS